MPRPRRLPAAPAKIRVILSALPAVPDGAVDIGREHLQTAVGVGADGQGPERPFPRLEKRLPSQPVTGWGGVALPAVPHGPILTHHEDLKAPIGVARKCWCRDRRPWAQVAGDDLLPARLLERVPSIPVNGAGIGLRGVPQPPVLATTTASRQLSAAWATAGPSPHCPLAGCPMANGCQDDQWPAGVPCQACHTGPGDPVSSVPRRWHQWKGLYRQKRTIIPDVVG